MLKLFLFLFAVMLYTAIADDCSTDGCDCGEWCVHEDNAVCDEGDDNTSDCSCKKGCRNFDIFYTEEDGQTDVYCNTCFCLGKVGSCGSVNWCPPEDREVGLAYPTQSGCY